MEKKTTVISPEDLQRQEGFCGRVREYWQAQGITPVAFVETYGCQQNEADSEQIRGMLEHCGYGLTDGPEGADLVIFNTCAIREHAEQRVFGNVGALVHTRRRHPRQKIFLCGCMMGQPAVVERVRKSYPYVDGVFSTHHLWELPQLLLGVLTTGKRVFSVEDSAGAIAEGLPVVRENKLKAWVSVMYGCNNFCSYCIVPYVRGRERSRKAENILAEVESLVKQGYKEITLLGQNVNSYGNDLSDGSNFADLLDKAASVEGKFRLRFMTNHPKDFTEDVVRVMKKHEGKICRLVHLPVQSGSNEILKQMNRRYTAEKYLGEVRMLKTLIPEAEVTTDIIVGFPGETEEDYLQTEALVKEADFASAFTFVYSRRSGTKAAEMDNQIPEEVSKNRIMRLVELVNSKTREKSEKYVGKTVEILCEDYDEKKKTYLGRDEFGRMAYFPYPHNLIGKFVSVHVNSANGISLTGDVVAVED